MRTAGNGGCSPSTAVPYPHRIADSCWGLTGNSLGLSIAVVLVDPDIHLASQLAE